MCVSQKVRTLILLHSSRIDCTIYINIIKIDADILNLEGSKTLFYPKINSHNFPFGKKHSYDIINIKLFEVLELG